MKEGYTFNGTLWFKEGNLVVSMMSSNPSGSSPDKMVGICVVCHRLMDEEIPGQEGMIHMDADYTRNSHWLNTSPDNSTSYDLGYRFIRGELGEYASYRYSEMLNTSQARLGMQDALGDLELELYDIIGSCV